MKLREWQEKLIVEDAVGGAAPTTTSSNVAYIPSDVPAVSNELTRLSKKKNKWGITIMECPYDYTVSFEDYSNIVVPVQLWEHFKTTIFGTSTLPEGPFEVDLSSYLAEALTDEVEKSLYNLRTATIQFLNSDAVASQRHKVASFETIAGSNINYRTEGKSVIQGINVEQQLENFVKLVQSMYGNDVGSIQLVTEALQQRSPLTEVHLFERFDNIISIVLSSDILVYTSVISLDFVIREELKFSSSVPRGLSIFKVEGNTVYPTSPRGFPSNITDYLKG